MDKFYSVEVKSNGSFWVSCAYCGKKSCGDCVFPYSDTVFEKYFEEAS
jgi:hypothetical protein